MAGYKPKAGATTAFRQYDTNFARGELDPKLAARIDINAYKNGAKKVRDWSLIPTGGVRRRPGTKRLGVLASVPRFAPFIYAQNQRYLIGFVDSGFTVYDDSGTVITTVTGAPWTADILSELKWAQARDTMIVCHDTFAPRKILRASAASFTLATLSYETSDRLNYQPYYKHADQIVSGKPLVTTADTSTSFCVTAAYFTASWVGLYLRHKGKQMVVTAIPAVGGAVNVTGAVSGTANKIKLTAIAHGLLTGYYATVASVTGTTEANGSWRVTRVDADHVELDASTFVNAYVAGGTIIEVQGSRATVTTLETMTDTNASTDWDEQAFSSIYGYPKIPLFHDERLWFFGHYSVSDAVWASKIAAYFNYSTGTALASEGIAVTIGQNRANIIQGVCSANHLQVFTNEAEFYVPATESAPITPTTINFRKQSEFGSGDDIIPIVLDGATLFIQKNTDTVREFIFNDTRQAYDANNILILSSHLLLQAQDMRAIRGGANQPEQCAFVLNADGTLAQFISVRAEEIGGWALWTIQSGTVKAIGELDEVLFLCVEDDGVYYLEQLVWDDTWTLDGAFYQTTGVATTSWTGLSNYEGEEVHLVSGTRYLGTATVSGGAVELEEGDEVTELLVGFNYEPELTPMPPSLALLTGDMRGQLMHLIRLTVNCFETLSLKIDDFRTQFLEVDDDLVAGTDPFTGHVEQFLDQGWDRDPTVPITQVEPLQATVLGAAIELEV